MIHVAITGWVVYFFLAFVVRSVVQLRLTGSTGFVGVRRGAGLLERATGGLLVAAFGLSLVAPLLGAPVLDTTVAGAILIALGTGGTLVAQLTMSRSWRIGVDPAERTELVTRGAFAVVRNPIFTFMLITSAGLALACPTPAALLAPPLLLLALELQVRLVEEPHLARTHDDAYRAYARRTGRFVPGLGRL